MAPKHTDLEQQLEPQEEEQLEPQEEDGLVDPVAYRLAGDVTALRHTIGHNEVSLDDDGVYTTRRPEEIWVLDALAHVERCEVPA